MMERKIITMLCLNRSLKESEIISIKSFNKKYLIHLYSYFPLNLNIEGVKLINANSVLNINRSQKFTNLNELKRKFVLTYLYNIGGTYIDPDFILINDLPKDGELFIRNQFGKISTRIIRSVKGSPVIESLLKDQNELEIIKKHGLELQNYNKYYFIYPDYVNEYFTDKFSIDPILRSSTICMWSDLWNKSYLDHTLFSFIEKNDLKLSGYITVTEPFKTGYPIVECVKSLLPLLDEIVVIYGRDEEESRKELTELDPKIKTIITNKWVQKWHYSSMTEHMHLGLMSCTGDFIFKIDSDYIFNTEDPRKVDKYRGELKKRLYRDHVTFFPKCNYMANGYFCYIEKNIYAVNKYLLDKDGLKYKIAVDKYVNKLMIDGKYNEGVIDDTDLTVFNYDCTTMNWDQFIEKQRGWFSAYYKFAGSLKHFDLTIQMVNDDQILYKYVVERLLKRVEWGIKKGVLFKRGIEFNPVYIRNVIKDLGDDKYGKSYFDCSEIMKLLK